MIVSEAATGKVVSVDSCKPKPTSLTKSCWPAYGGPSFILLDQCAGQVGLENCALSLVHGQEAASQQILTG